MAQDTLTFCCPACGIKLSVPASLAGVVGPCPSCGSRIQAPHRRRPEGLPGCPAAPKRTRPAASRPRHLSNRSPASFRTGRIPRSWRNKCRNPARPAKAAAGTTRSQGFPRSETSCAGHDVALFLIASAALVYGVLTFLKRQNEKERQETRTSVRPEPAHSPEAAEAIRNLPLRSRNRLPNLPHRPLHRARNPKSYRRRRIFPKA